MGLAVGFRLLEFSHHLEGRECPANQPMKAHYLAVELHPVRFGREQLFDGMLDFQLFVAKRRHFDESPYSGAVIWGKCRNTVHGLGYPLPTIVLQRAIQLQPWRSDSFKLMQCKHLWHCLQILPNERRRWPLPSADATARGPTRILIDKFADQFTCHCLFLGNRIFKKSGSLVLFSKVSSTGSRRNRGFFPI